MASLIAGGLVDNTDEAVQLGRALLKRGDLHHATYDFDFGNNVLYYVFTPLPFAPSSSSSPSGTQPPKPEDGGTENKRAERGVKTASVGRSRRSSVLSALQEGQAAVSSLSGEQLLKVLNNTLCMR